jgi:molecular chaperone GrpE
MKKQDQTQETAEPIQNGSDRDTTIEVETQPGQGETVSQETEEVAGASSGSDSEPNPEQTSADDMEKLQGELALVKDQFLRQAADFQNYRRRVMQERNQLITQGRAHVAERMVDVLDDLKRSIEAADPAEDEVLPEKALEALKTGLALVYEKFVSELARLDVEAMEVVGQPFNEDEHDALMQQPAPEGVESGTVLAEIQRGYRMGDRILRHAKVIVAM